MIKTVKVTYEYESGTKREYLQNFYQLKTNIRDVLLENNICILELKDMKIVFEFAN